MSTEVSGSAVSGERQHGQQLGCWGFSFASDGDRESLLEMSIGMIRLIGEIQDTDGSWEYRKKSVA